MSKIVTASKLNRLWKNGVLPIKSKVDNLEENGSNTVANKLSSYNDVIANTVEGYIPDALAVKEGFNQVNSSLEDMKVSFQDGCNTIYNAVVAKGVTPKSKSPEDIATAISSIQADVKHTVRYHLYTDTFYYDWWIDGVYKGQSGFISNGEIQITI